MGGFLNRKGSSSSVLDAIQEVVVSTSTVLTGNTSQRVFVDTNGGPVAITLPAGVKGQSIRVIDAGDNAGTDIITIVGTIDSVSGASIQADGGSREFTFSGTAWESSGGVDQLFQRLASTGTITAKAPDTFASDQLQAGDTGTTFTGLYSADFSNAEANVDTSGTGWGNDPASVDVTTAVTWTAGANLWVFDNVTEALAQEALDGDTTGFSVAGSSSGFVIDLGEVKNLSTIRIQTGNPTRHQVISWSNDWDGTSGTFTEITGYTHSSSQYDIDVSGISARYIRQLGNANYCVAGMFIVNESGYASSTNTFQYRIATAGSSASYAPSTFAPTDDTDTPITDGNILIEYSDDGSTWSSQVGLTAFKALSSITSGTFWLRFEMVGETKLKQVTISTTSSFAQMTSTGLEIEVASVVGTRIGDKGIAFNGDTADENYLNDYEQGTWTPVGEFETSETGALTYTIQTGTYTKIGDVVHVQCTLAWNANGYSASSGSFCITGLPFVCGSSPSSFSLGYITNFVTGLTVYGYALRVDASTSSVLLNYADATDGSVDSAITAHTQLNSVGTIIFSGSYKV